MPGLNILLLGKTFLVTDSSILGSVGIVSKMFFGALEIYRFSCHYKIFLNYLTKIILINIPLMLKVWLSSVQFLRNSPVAPILFTCGILPCNESFSLNRLIFNEVNHLLKSKCSVKNFHFINQSNGWTLNNRALDFSIFYSDSLHLKKGNLKVG